MSEIPDGMYMAVVDRIEDELAALEVSTEERRYEATVPFERLPEAGRSPDSVLSVTVENGDIVELEYDPGATAERSDDAQSRFDRLSRRPPDDES